MFNVTELPVEPVRNELARLPITALLVIPDDPSLSVRPFNLPGAVNHLMGGSGWDRATKVLRPRIWASGWSDEDVASFVSAPFLTEKRAFPLEAIADIREVSFPPMGGRIDLNRAWPQYEIVHVLGDYELTAYSGEPLLRLFLKEGWVQADDFLAGRVMAAGTLRDVLVGLQTRLLILQAAAFSSGNAARLARYLVGGGGPAAAVVVSGGTPDGLEKYFTDLYANIIHNEPMRSVAKPGDIGGAPDVELLLGEHGDDTLRFDRWLEHLNNMIDDVQSIDRQVLERIGGDRLRFLHVSQQNRLKERLYSEAIGEDASAFLRDLPRLDSLRSNINHVAAPCAGRDTSS
jgi:hypothetical protein